MKNDNTKVLFDPGYAPLVIDSFGQVGYIYYTFSVAKDLKFKRMNFPHTLRKLEEHLKLNVSFYLGCLLWANYISQFDNCEIEGNKLLGEDAKEEEYTSEINFLIDLIENQLPRDCKYYQNKIYETNEKYLPILKTYKDFLILNNGFVNCSKTNQIIIPSNLKKQTKETLENIYNNIQESLNNKDISQLLNSYELIF